MPGKGYPTTIPIPSRDALRLRDGIVPLPGCDDVDPV